jgi:hypothetical protein
MPNRRELAIPAMRRRESVAGTADAWAVVSVCTTGWLVSAFLTAYSASFDTLMVLIAQIPWG